MTRLRGPVLCLAFVLTVSNSAYYALPASTTSERSCWSYRASERALARAINRKRSARDITKLQLDKHISQVSRVHTGEMISDDDFAHTPITTLAERVTNWIELGENIGRTTGRMRRIVRAMMNSPTHRANILNPTFTYLGVGTQQGSGRMWATITFEARNDPGTTLRMPSC